MNVLKEGVGFTFINAIKLIMSQWQLRKKEIDLIASSRLSELFDSSDKLVPFYKMIQEYSEELKLDLNNFVARVAPDSKNDTLSIGLRFAYKSYNHALTRLKTSLDNIFKNGDKYFTKDLPNDLSNDVFSKMMLIPDTSVYHGEVCVVSDIPHRVYNICSVEEHGDRLEVLDHRPSLKQRLSNKDPFDESVLETVLIIYNNERLNKIAEYVALLDSYPIIPPDLSGSLLTTHGFDEYEDLELHSPGKDNRCRVTKASDSRVCVACKIDNLAFGHTDIIEQDRRCSCNCATKICEDVFIEEGDDLITTLITTRSTMKTRELIMKKEGGCTCVKHNDVAKNNIMRFTEILRNMNVTTC